MKAEICALLLCLVTAVHASSEEPPDAGRARELHVTVDLNKGEYKTATLSDGNLVRLLVKEVQETRDSVRSALRVATVVVEVNGQPITLISGNYQLPRSIAGVQIDCPATLGLYRDVDPFEDSWGLEKEVRLRIWPMGSPWIETDSFVYPARQRWFGTATQFSNEPSHVDGGDAPTGRKIYYHSGLDIGGCEGLTEVISACDGLVVSSGGKTLPEYPDLPYYKKNGDYDYVYVEDKHGWMYRYAHLFSIDKEVVPGSRVKMGQRLGLLGKEGSAGGWSHLHFDIKCRQPSGKWGILDGYAFLWQAYLRERQPAVIAVAKPHHTIWQGEKVTLDGSKSWAASGNIASFQWTLSNGEQASTPTVEQTYEECGEYSEILKVTDDKGNIDYDFNTVLVIDRKSKGEFSPTLHASYFPTEGIKPGEPVTFKVRSFYTIPLGEKLDFGDGSEPVLVRSDGNADAGARDGYAETTHRYKSPGDYVVKIEQIRPAGPAYTQHLHVHVESTAGSASIPENEVWREWLKERILPRDQSLGMMRAYVERQLQPIKLPDSLAEWKAGRAAVREKVLRSIGIDDLIPPKWDLKVEERGVIEREKYRIKKLTYESYPGLKIPALLYIPKGIRGKMPGIVSISGHTRESKAAEYVQQRNINLALRGCVVLCYDYYGYGDRRTGSEPGYPTEGNSHGIRSFSFSRRAATAIEVLDAWRAVDLIASLPEVDTARIGFTGESGGSNSTYWCSAIDDRIRLAVPVCSVSTFNYWIRTDVNWDWHQRPPGILQFADIGTLLALHSPNPLLIISSQRGTDDTEFPLDQAEESHQWARRVYQLFEQSDAIGHYESTTKHGYQVDKREQLYAAVEKWLTPPRGCGAREIDVPVESEADLAVSLPADNHTFRSIYEEWVKDLPSEIPSQSGARREFLRARLGWPAEPTAVGGTKMYTKSLGDLRAEFWLVTTEQGIQLPAIFLTGIEGSGEVVLIPGRDPDAISRALSQKKSVLTFDLRGAGEMECEHADYSIWSSMAGEPWNSVAARVDGAFLNWSWFAGRPLAGQWALDLHQMAGFARSQLGATSVSVRAENGYGWAALLAAAAEDRQFDSGNVRIPHGSLRHNLQARGDAALADIPGLFERMDIPQIIELWPKGQVTIAAGE